MIPRVLHWGLFGGWKLSALNRDCMASWAAVLPEYTVMAWDDRNGPNRSFFRRALKESPINAHNYIGLYALYHHGGVMLDNDVEVIRPFDLNHGMFIGFQRKDSDGLCINNAVIGAIPRHPLIRRCLRRMERGNPNGDPLWFGCGLLTDELRQIGMTGVNVEQKLGDVMVYDRERLYPYFHDEPVIPREKLTDRTLAVHRWEGSWRQRKI
jgi:hypothetical protein